MRMKRGIKILASMMVMSMISVAFTGMTYALSFNFKVTANKTQVKPGEEITVSMKIGEINMGELRNKRNRRHIRL